MTVSSHRPHPEATHPVITHTCSLPFVMTNSFIAIAEDVLAIFFWIENPGLIIWNWKSGKLLVVSSIVVSPNVCALTYSKVRNRLRLPASGHLGLFVHFQPRVHPYKPRSLRLD